MKRTVSQHSRKSKPGGVSSTSYFSLTSKNTKEIKISIKAPIPSPMPKIPLPSTALYIGQLTLKANIKHTPNSQPRLPVPKKESQSFIILQILQGSGSWRDLQEEAPLDSRCPGPRADFCLAAGFISFPLSRSGRGEGRGRGWPGPGADRAVVAAAAFAGVRFWRWELGLSS